jgi:hypothetical protein
LVEAAHELANATVRGTLAEGILWYSLVLPTRRYLEWGSGGTTTITPCGWPCNGPQPACRR